MIYLDYNATTPVDPEVAEAMQPMIHQVYGNPSSNHEFGVTAKKTIENARVQVAGLINCQPSELIFTSGGTESNNLAIQGVARALKNKGKHIITSTIEHPAVSEVCAFLASDGFEITAVDVDANGLLDLEKLKQSIRPDTILISIMHANNEVGTIQEIDQIGKLASENGIIFHCDAAQSTGKIPIDVVEMKVDLLSIAGHKLYAPKGVGALYIKTGTPLEKLMFGANHEQNIRPGTENILEIAGLGKAAEIACRDLEINRQHSSSLRDQLWTNLYNALPEIKRNGHPEKSLPNTLSVSFPGIEANTLVNRLDNIAVSAGAACHADNIDVSTVLEAMKIPVQFAMGTIRFSTGKFNTTAEIDIASKKIIDTLGQLGQMIISDNEESSEIRLTSLTHGLGCACKIEPGKLEGILTKMPKSTDPNVIIGIETADDASVYRLTDDLSIVQTLDFLTPVVDNAYDFGAIAAANALSDIYAMGAEPLYAQNIVGFPINVLPVNVLEEILKGASDKASEAGISIIGGHTVEDPEPKFGMVVTGSINPKNLLRNNTAKEGDKLILTKPLGSGIMTTALKKGMLDKKTETALTETMSGLNKYASSLLAGFRVHACTDITGFGLLGHLLEMTKGSACNAELRLDDIPCMDGTKDLASSGIVPGGSKRNLDHVIDWVNFRNLPQYIRLMLSDAQTSGGLLISVHPEDADELVKELSKKLDTVAIIGTMSRKGKGIIEIRQAN